MSKTAYSPDTGELIVTSKPSAWMGLTDLVPPVFDSATQGCFFREGAWVIVDAQVSTTRTEIKAQKWLEIKADRDRRTQSGGYKVGEKWFHSDTFSRTQQMGLVMAGANIPENTLWKTMDGSTVIMTSDLASKIFSAAVASDVANFGAAETHKSAMETCADPSVYDFAKGWPKVFGEA